MFAGQRRRGKWSLRLFVALTRPPLLLLLAENSFCSSRFFPCRTQSVLSALPAQLPLKGDQETHQVIQRRTTKEHADRSAEIEAAAAPSSSLQFWYSRAHGFTSAAEGFTMQFGRCSLDLMCCEIQCFSNPHIPIT